MKKCFLTVAVLVFLLSCAEIERDNPYDIRASNYREDLSKEGSSSSMTAGEPSSSGNENPSSGSVAPSSSSSSISSSSSSSTQQSSSSAPPTQQSSSSNPNSGASSSSQQQGGQDGVVYGTPVDYEGETYQTVVIGAQTWMAKNLNYNASDSKCYGDNSGSDSQDRCGTYGRLYNWATAMNLASTCNSSSCSVEAKHRGICPAGWHIPSNADWDVLMTAVGGSATAGTHLKAKSGWNSYTGIENLDTYGFSALPGGNADGSFYSVGSSGFWWSTTEGSADNAYYWRMNYNVSSASRNSLNKVYLYSVRCLQD
jgi:uncharacterized protein (TIGR02145 family)